MLLSNERRVEREEGPGKPKTALVVRPSRTQKIDEKWEGDPETVAVVRYLTRSRHMIGRSEESERKGDRRAPSSSSHSS